ncbi:MAG: methylamine utilization protein [Fimbriimonadaceae bacterium]
MNRRLVPALLATIAAFAVVGTAYAGRVSKTSGSAEIVGMVKKGSGRVKNAVVSLIAVPGSYRPAAGVVKMDQQDKEFVPHVLAVMKGTTVRFSNSDPFFHNVFSSSRVQEFNVSQEKRGDFTDIKFNRPGIVPIKCHIHASMKAYIIVLANPFFAVTSSAGLFRITGVPAGTYTLKVWSEEGSTTQSITVPASGAAKAVIQL